METSLQPTYIGLHVEQTRSEWWTFPALCAYACKSVGCCWLAGHYFTELIKAREQKSQWKQEHILNLQYNGLCNGPLRRLRLNWSRIGNTNHGSRSTTLICNIYNGLSNGPLRRLHLNWSRTGNRNYSGSRNLSLIYNFYSGLSNGPLRRLHLNWSRTGNTKINHSGSRNISLICYITTYVMDHREGHTWTDHGPETQITVEVGTYP